MFNKYQKYKLKYLKMKQLGGAPGDGDGGGGDVKRPRYSITEADARITHQLSDHSSREAAEQSNHSSREAAEQSNQSSRDVIIVLDTNNKDSLTEVQNFSWEQLRANWTTLQQNAARNDNSTPLGFFSQQIVNKINTFISNDTLWGPLFKKFIEKPTDSPIEPRESLLIAGLEQNIRNAQTATLRVCKDPTQESLSPVSQSRGDNLETDLYNAYDNEKIRKLFKTADNIIKYWENLEHIHSLRDDIDMYPQVMRNFAHQLIPSMSPVTRRNLRHNKTTSNDKDNIMEAVRLALQKMKDEDILPPRAPPHATHHATGTKSKIHLSKLKISDLRAIIFSFRPEECTYKTRKEIEGLTEEQLRAEARLRRPNIYL